MNWTLDKEAWAKIGKGFLLAMAGAAGTYISTMMLGLDFGLATPVITALLSVLANYLRKVATGA